MTEIPVKILIIRFSSIGDIVLTTPIIRCLKQQLEGNIEVHYLTKQQFKPILENNPHISKIHTIKENVAEVIPQLKAEKYNYIIDLHKNLRSKSVIRKLNIIDFTFDKLNIQKWLYTNFKINKLPNIHIVDRYFNAVAPLGIENDLEGLEIFLGEQDQVTELPFTHQKGYIAIAIGAQYYTKCLPVDKLITLCGFLNQPIILLGGKEDMEKGAIISQTNPELIYNGCGKYTLNQSAYLVQQSKLLITNDTGLMHIGVALGKKIISVWGNTVPEFGMYPYYPKNAEKYAIIENNNLNCRPCSKIGYAACPKKHFKCMNDLNMEEIVAKVKEFSLMD